MNSLQQKIQDLATAFANDLLRALRSIPLSELAADGEGPKVKVSRDSSKFVLPAKAKKGGGRLARRSPDQIAKAVEKIVALLKEHPEGLGAERIRELSKIDRRELGRPIADALATGKIWKEGEKRATVYRTATTKRVPKKPAVKGAKKPTAKGAKKPTAKGAAPKKVAAAPKKTAKKAPGKKTAKSAKKMTPKAPAAPLTTSES